MAEIRGFWSGFIFPYAVLPAIVSGFGMIFYSSISFKRYVRGALAFLFVWFFARWLSAFCAGSVLKDLSGRSSTFVSGFEAGTNAAAALVVVGVLYAAWFVSFMRRRLRGDESRRDRFDD